MTTGEGGVYNLLVSNTETIPGMTITQALGLATGSTVRAKHIGKDILAGFRSIVGGEVSEYTKMLAESREQAVDRMIEDAKSKGADGIVGMKFTTSAILQGSAELLAYGTAVNLQK